MTDIQVHNFHKQHDILTQLSLGRNRQLLNEHSNKISCSNHTNFICFYCSGWRCSTVVAAMLTCSAAVVWLFWFFSWAEARAPRDVDSDLVWDGDWLPCAMTSGMDTIKKKVYHAAKLGLSLSLHAHLSVKPQQECEDLLGQVSYLTNISHKSVMAWLPVSSWVLLRRSVYTVVQVTWSLIVLLWV